MEAIEHPSPVVALINLLFAPLGIHIPDHMVFVGLITLIILFIGLAIRSSLSVDNPGKLPQLFEFIMQAGPMDQREAFATFNMGIGFAVWVDPRDVSRVVELATGAGYHAWHAGHAVKNGDRKAVEILPMNITFEAETLSLR